MGAGASKDGGDDKVGKAEKKIRESNKSMTKDEIYVQARLCAGRIDRQVRFDVTELARRDTVLLYVPSVKDTKGGTSGSLSLTALRVIFADTKGKSSLHIGWGCVMSLELQGKVLSMLAQEKDNKSRFEFKFELPMASDVERAKDAVLLYQCYKRTDHYRTLRLRQKDVFQGGQPRLLLGEGHVEEFRSPVYNLAGKGSTPSPGKMFLTDVRVLWRADQNHEFNISIPITKIEGVSTRTTDSSGLALVVNTGADASNLVLGFTAGRNGGEEHLTRELFASVRQRWRANVTQPRFGTEAYFECAKAIGGTLPQSDEAFLAALVAARNGVGLQLQASLAAPGAGTSGGASGSQAAGTAGEGSAEVTATVTAAKDMAAAAAEATKGEGSGAAAVAEAAAAAKDNATTVFAAATGDPLLTAALGTMQGLIQAGCLDRIVSSVGKCQELMQVAACIGKVKATLANVPIVGMLGPVWEIAGGILDACGKCIANAQNCYKLARLVLVVSTSLSKVAPKRLQDSKLAVEDLKEALQAALDQVQSYQGKGMFTKYVFASQHKDAFEACDADLRAKWQGLANDIVLQGAPSDARYEEDARLREAMVKAAGTDQAGKAWEVLKDDPAAQDRLLEALGVSHQMVVQAVKAHMERALNKNKSSMRRVIQETIHDSLEAFQAVLGQLTTTQLTTADGPKDIKHTTEARVDEWAAPLIESVTDNFAADRLLGSGGFAKVYRATVAGFRGKRRDVAVKRFFIQDESAVEEQILNEAEILGTLKHAGIVRLLALCWKPACLVYELCEGGTVADRLEGRQGGLGWQARVRVLRETAVALQFMHSARGEGAFSKGVYHRDIKPANLLLSVPGDDASVKLADFGVARVVDEDREAGASVTTRLMGTSAYMDPVYVRTRKYGPHCDVYSLGVVMVQLATGCSGPRALVVAEDPSGATPDAKAGDWMAAVFTEVLQMGLRCMRDRPDDRPSLLEVIESLRAAEKAGAEGDGTLLATTAEIRRRHEEHERLKQALLAEQSKLEAQLQAAQEAEKLDEERRLMEEKLAEMRRQLEERTRGAGAK